MTIKGLPITPQKKGIAKILKLKKCATEANTKDSQQQKN
jgi:hypothetical protein